MGLLLGITGCANTINLIDPGGPRYAAAYGRPPTEPSAPPDHITVVTFNLKLGRRLDRAIDLLRADPLRSADVISLQEMDEVGVDSIARALGLNYVYYPSVIHPTRQRNFGPALLSRWPIESDWKVVLPCQGRGRQQRRTATAGVVRIGGVPILVYAMHLETQVRISETDRVTQVGGVLQDAENWPGPVIIAGDMNGYELGFTLERAGYTWATKHLRNTVFVFAWDHIFARGLELARGRSSGVVRKVHGASDHRPVWAVFRLPPTPDSP